MSREEAYALIQAACDARDEGLDNFMLARTDSLILGWDDAMTRAKELARNGVDAVCVGAFPDVASMRCAVEENRETNVCQYHRRWYDAESFGRGFCRARHVCNCVSMATS